MKIFRKIFIVLLSFVSIVSCDKSKDEIIEDAVGKLEANISGESWSANAPVAVITDSSIIITGIAQGEKSIVLSAFGSGTGTYSLKPLDLKGTGIYKLTKDTTTTIYTAISGTLTISEKSTSSKRVSGSFFFDAYSIDPVDSVQVTNGVFENILFSQR